MAKDPEALGTEDIPQDQLEERLRGFWEPCSRLPEGGEMGQGQGRGRARTGAGKPGDDYMAVLPSWKPDTSPFLLPPSSGPKGDGREQ